jgi:hypothetical protein
MLAFKHVESLFREFNSLLPQRAGSGELLGFSAIETERSD